MDSLVPLFAFVAGAALAGALVWFLARRPGTAEAEARAQLRERTERVEQLLQEAREAREREEALRAKDAEARTQLAALQATLREEREAAKGKIALLEDAERKLADAFKALSSDALKSNNAAFLELARATLERFQESARGDLEKRQQAIDQLVTPVRESLQKFQQEVQKLEQTRAVAYSTLSQQVNSLRGETGQLVQALRRPQVRGRWGEVQLRRVVEMAGMLEHCDFEEQQSTTTEEGRLRPDLVVNMPNGRHIVIDAKAPLDAYLQAMEAPDDETRKARLADHARQIRDHVRKLGQKAYWAQFQPTPDFVVLFVPGEMFYAAALQEDPTLIDQGVEQGVLVAAPTTLIALLKAVAYGWRQERLEEHAKEISELGKELYERLAVLGGHFADLGKGLERAVGSYNKAVGSLESRVLVSARRFQELQAADSSREIPAGAPIDLAPRQLQAPELAEPEAASRIDRVCEAPWKPAELKDAVDPGYDVLAEREREKPS